MLVVAVVDTTWKTQLERLADQLIFRLNSVLGAPIVSRVSFRVDPSAVGSYNAHDEETIAPGDVEAVAHALEPDAEAIPDPALRDAFVRAASRCLARAGEEAKRRR